MKPMLTIAFITAIVLLSACAVPPVEQNKGSAADTANMANPASQYCVDQGHKLEIRAGEGGETGYCRFADGSECEEWAFFRGECAPGETGQ